MNLKTLSFTILAILFTTLTFAHLSSPTFASEIQVVNQNLSTYQGDFLFDNITYLNKSKKPETIILKIVTFDKKSNQEISQSPFITIKSNKYTVKAKKEVSIPYIISIPTDINPGTYFNKITLLKSEKIGKENQTLNTEISVYEFTINVFSSESSLDKVFFDQSDIKLIVHKKGLPYLTPTIFEYVYTNNSNFVFSPKVTIQILNPEGKVVLDNFKINEQSENIFPGESISGKFQANLWDNLYDSLQTKTIVSTTTNGENSTPVQNKIDINISYQLGIILFILTAVVLSMITAITLAVINKTKVKKEKESEMLSEKKS